MNFDENYPVIVKKGIPPVLVSQVENYRKVVKYPFEPKASLLKRLSSEADLLSIKNVDRQN